MRKEKLQKKPTKGQKTHTGALPPQSVSNRRGGAFMERFSGA